MKIQKSVRFAKKKIEDKYLKDKKNIVKLQIIVIIQENTEVLRIANVFQNIVNLNEFMIKLNILYT